MKIKVAGIVILTATITFRAFYVWYFKHHGTTQTEREDFENGLGSGVVDAEVPFDPNTGGFVEWNITRSTDVASSGRYSLKFFIDARQDDGTIWIERKIAVRKGVQIQVSLSFDFYSDHESLANTRAVICAYVGFQRPRTEEHFIVIGIANEVEGCKKFNYTIA
ncbi:hypothetical protein KEJ19_06495 [Candidatus Bathyarchaeota archaeon]|nr:hypothetical protein [Candidatus Bathyarchaeota archaeon]